MPITWACTLIKPHLIWWEVPLWFPSRPTAPLGTSLEVTSLGITWASSSYHILMRRETGINTYAETCSNMKIIGMCKSRIFKSGQRKDLDLSSDFSMSNFENFPISPPSVRMRVHHTLYKQPYGTSPVYVQISHQLMAIGSILKVDSSNFLIVTHWSQSLTNDNIPLYP
jgi:hypothetical protein